MTLNDLQSENKVYQFSNLEFTKNAFLACFDNLSLKDLNEISELEKFGKELLQNNQISLQDSDLFCKKVCDWGRQNRVYANIKRLSPNNYQSLLSNWFNHIKNQQQYTNKEIKYISKMGDDIPGLGISFVSKHLRMLKPEIFPVLDDVLSQALGFALNENGYVLFIDLLNDFISKNKELFNNNYMNISQVEICLFLMSRQLVRSQ